MYLLCFVRHINKNLNDNYLILKKAKKYRQKLYFICISYISQFLSVNNFLYLIVYIRLYHIFYRILKGLGNKE